MWHEQRRFALRYLRDYGFGRRFQSLEIEIQDEMRCFIEMVKYGPKYPHEKVHNANCSGSYVTANFVSDFCVKFLFRIISRTAVSYYRLE